MVSDAVRPVDTVRRAALVVALLGASGTGRHLGGLPHLLSGLAGALMLQLPDYWIWDSWIAEDGELYHLAAPLVQQRDGEWALIGFRNLEPEGIFAFEILDPTRAGA
jgi:hypothetical protein